MTKFDSHLFSDVFIRVDIWRVSLSLPVRKLWFFNLIPTFPNFPNSDHYTDYISDYLIYISDSFYLSYLPDIFTVTKSVSYLFSDVIRRVQIWRVTLSLPVCKLRFSNLVPTFPNSDHYTVHISDYLWLKNCYNIYNIFKLTPNQLLYFQVYRHWQIGALVHCLWFILTCLTSPDIVCSFHDIPELFKYIVTTTNTKYVLI